MALGAEALLAPPEHYAAELGELWVDRSEAAAMARVRELLEGASTERRPFQAPVSFRIIPRMVGIAYRSQELAEDAAATMLRAVSDNPVYVPPADGRPDGDIWSTGGYHPAQAIQAMDNLAYAWANLCQLAYHQSVRLQGDEFGLGSQNQFQGGRPGGGMGNAAWAYEMAQLAQPTLLPLTGSGQTDAGSMSFAAWRKATEIGRGLDAMLAGISATASEIFDLTGRQVPPALEDYLAFVRSYREPNGSSQTLGDDLGALADAITARVHGAAAVVSR
jgi:histidine ammonia-lyase